jgi:hypothetical protein
VDYRLGRIARVCGIDPADLADRLTAFTVLYARDRARYNPDQPLTGALPPLMPTPH